MIEYVIFDMFETLVSLYNVDKHYFGRQIAEDMDVSWEAFCAPWRSTDKDRTLGKISFKDTIELLMKEFSCYSEEKLVLIEENRREFVKRSFEEMQSDIITMLQELQKAGCRIAILSNCYYEERDCIRESEMEKLADVLVLSCEVGMAKPDEGIFSRCMKELWLGEGPMDAKRYLYVGDGGSQELETAEKCGMTAGQALWYLNRDMEFSMERKKNFMGFHQPGEVVKYVKKVNA